jgi:eukaryotic-like serine/threonine-protein kinase
MSSDFTQQQTLGELQKAEQLSLQSTVPPAEIPGYRIEKLLGQGAFGQVWLGRDLNTGRQVAVKFYLHRGGVNWSLLSREVKHLVNMSSGRHIVQVLGVGWEAEPPYYCMEFLENGSVEDLIRVRGALGTAEAVALFREIAEGLNFAHGKGVLHCDLKPANVLLDHDWRPRLADFGQSRMSHEQTPSLGTLFYMAPEQADLTASVDAKWDVYALGAIMYAMLVGTPPYRSTEFVEQLYSANSLPERLQRYRTAIKESPLPQLHYRRRGVDKQLCLIVDKCLAKRPEDRFSNVQQVLEALQRRDAARLRRPLLILGIVGPILLSVLMLMFSARSMGVARDNSLAAVQQWALRSNQFAAMFAARTLESEIATLFRDVEIEADRGELDRRLRELLTTADEPLKLIADGKDRSNEREQLFALAEQSELERYLNRRIAEMTRNAGNNNESTVFSSLFVTDARGTIVAIAFSDLDELSQSPVGRNFAYRTYFTGKREDDEPKKGASEYEPTRHTHLSTSFRSTSTGKWKVAVSSPIWPVEYSQAEDEQARAKIQPLGVLVLTINLGDFELLSGQTHEQSEARFAVLVDGRSGTQQGTLLQHPVLQAMESRFQATQKLEIVPQIDKPQLDDLRARGLVNYRDPASRIPEGEAFSGTWVAAIQQVRLPTNAERNLTDRASDLWVLVQERTSYVEEPVQVLGARLQRESYLELAVLACVVALMWYFVNRTGKSIVDKAAHPDSSNSLHYSATKTTLDR